MAKDGTLRGGQRVGAGRKPNALVDKVNAGMEAMVMDLPDPDPLVGEDMPPVKEYMKSEQQIGIPLCAEEVFKDTWNWLKERGCEKLVNTNLIEQYAMSVARWIQAEEAVSKFGFLARHPTTKAAIASPYISMAQTYMKQVNTTWYQIFQVVKENSMTAYEGGAPHEDKMELLLRMRGG